MKAKLYTLYMTYNDGGYYRVLFNVASNIVANTASNYTAYNFFNDKQSIAYAMQNNLNAYVQDTLFLTVETLQIILVELPAAFEDAILESISVKQNITKTQKYLEQMTVTFQTMVMAAQQSANQTITQAQGRAASILAAQTAAATALSQTVGAEVFAYGRIRTELNLTNDNLIEYVWWDSMAEAQGSSQFVVGLNPSTYIHQK